MLELLFGNRNVEKILFFLLRNGQCYASQLRKSFNGPLDPIQKALLKLEKAGILVSFLQGRTRLFEFNPRWPFLDEFRTFLERAYKALPAKIQASYEPKGRRRPRRSGKPI